MFPNDVEFHLRQNFAPKKPYRNKAPPLWSGLGFFRQLSLEYEADLSTELAKYIYIVSLSLSVLSLTHSAQGTTIHRSNTSRFVCVADVFSPQFRSNHSSALISPASFERETVHRVCRRRMKKKESILQSSQLKRARFY